MILSNAESESRLTNPDNLINQLRSRMNAGLISDRGMLSHLGLIKTKAAEVNIASLPPSVDDLIDDVEQKLDEVNAAKNNKAAKASAAAVLSSALSSLEVRIHEVERPKDLAKIATDMSRIINDGDDKKTGNSFNQVIVYRPIEVNVNSYETIRVHE